MSTCTLTPLWRLSLTGCECLASPRRSKEQEDQPLSLATNRILKRARLILEARDDVMHSLHLTRALEHVLCLIVFPANVFDARSIKVA